MRKSLLVSALVLFSVPAFSQEAYEVFLTKFGEAVKGDNYAAMKDLVIRNKEVIFPAWMTEEVQYCSAVTNKSDGDVKERGNVLEKLGTFANQEFKDRFYMDRQAWVKALTPEQCAKRMELQESLIDGDKAFKKAQKSGDAKDLADVRGKYEKSLGLAVGLKDLYWTIDVNVGMGGLAKAMGEKWETAYWYKRAMEIAREEKAIPLLAKYNLGEELKRVAREGIKDEIIDVTLAVDASKKKYAEQIEKANAAALNPGAATDSKPAGGAAAPGTAAGKAAMPSALPPPANKHTMRVEWTDAEKSKYKEITSRAFMTPNPKANGVWRDWYNTEVKPGPGVKAAGQPAGTAGIPGDNAFKNDKGKLTFDPDGAGKAPEEKMKVSEGKAEPVVFKGRTYADGTKADLHYRVMEQPTTFKVMGFQLKTTVSNPAERPVILFWQGATSVTTKFGGYDITIMDDSANGEFSDYGADTVVVSKGKDMKVAPLSRYLYLGDLLFEIKLDPSGQNIRFKPYDGPVALMQFDYVAATMPTFMILEGLNENAQVYFNLMDCKDKPMWVPPGEYKFAYGYFAFGEAEKRETIQVYNTKSTPIKVGEGKLNKVEMGAAKAPGFTFTWKAELEKDKGKTMIRVPGKHIKVFGCGGEEYSWFYTGSVKPTVKMRSGKDGPVFFDKQMKQTGQDDMTSSVPWTDIAFFPKDVEAEKTTSGDVFIQLEGEYPKLGKITSTPAQVE